MDVHRAGPRSCSTWSKDEAPPARPDAYRRPARRRREKASDSGCSTGLVRIERQSMTVLPDAIQARICVARAIVAQTRVDECSAT